MVAVVVDVFQEEFVLRIGQLRGIVFEKAVDKVGFDRKLRIQLAIGDESQILEARSQTAFSLDLSAETSKLIFCKRIVSCIIQLLFKSGV